MSLGSLGDLGAEVVACRRCPRLVAWREAVAAQPRASYAGQGYWGRPVPGFGGASARLVVVGLAPAAHGGNRTGRVFTGDRSGDWLWAALWRAGLANQPVSRARGDGLQAASVWVTAAVKCAPPQNRPTPAERDNCLAYLASELSLLREAKAVLALGAFAYDAVCRLLAPRKRPRPVFRHGLQVPLPDGRWLVCSYHPSQQNTFTGRLTEKMLDDVVGQAWKLASGARDEGASPISPP